MREAFALGLVIAGCGGPDGKVIDAMPDVALDAAVDDGRTVVANVRATVNANVDVLWVIDDSPGVLGMQTSVKNDVPNFINVLNGLEGGLPSVHIGVISPDLGTAGSDGQLMPTIGSGPGACSGNGKAGNLQTNGTPALNNGATFISDIRNTDGTRSKNYTGTLDSAFDAMASLGASGCEFEQPIEAARRALANNPANAGFRRPSAHLALVFVTNEDDCSMAHTTMMGGSALLGPRDSFRCTRFGVSCTGGGETPDEMDTVGSKTGCTSNNASPYMTAIPDYKTFFSGLTSVSSLFVGTLAAPITPVDVELRPDIPALAHSCTWVDQSTATSVGDPAVRLAELAANVPNHAIENACSQDVSAPLTAVSRGIGLMIGDPCIRYGATNLTGCIAKETSGGVSKEIPACDSTMTMPCWRITSDPVGCMTGAHNKLVIDRTSAPAADSVVELRCFTPF